MFLKDHLKTTHAFYPDKDEEGLDILYNNNCIFSYMLYVHVHILQVKEIDRNLGRQLVDAEVKINEE